MNLGDVQLDNGMSSLDPQSRIIYTEPPKTTENIFTDVPPLFSKYKLLSQISFSVIGFLRGISRMSILTGILDADFAIV